jgi:hypothetical protein
MTPDDFELACEFAFLCGDQMLADRGATDRERLDALRWQRERLAELIAELRACRDVMVD